MSAALNHGIRIVSSEILCASQNVYGRSLLRPMSARFQLLKDYFFRNASPRPNRPRHFRLSTVDRQLSYAST